MFHFSVKMSEPIPPCRIMSETSFRNINPGSIVATLACLPENEVTFTAYSLSLSRLHLVLVNSIGFG